MFVNQTQALTNMLIEGYGYGVLTKEFSKPYLDDGSFIALNNGKSYANNLVLAWYARPEPPAYFTSLVNVIS